MPNKHERITGLIPGMDDIGHKVSDNAGHTGYGKSRAEAEEALRVAQANDVDHAERDTRPIVGDVLPGYVLGRKLSAVGATRARASRLAESQRRERSNSTSTSDTALAEFAGKVIGVLILVAAVIWFVFAVAVPLLVIDVAALALFVGLANQSVRRLAFPLSVVGAVFVVVDYNQGWFTKALAENVSFLTDVVPWLLYINLFSGLTAAYFLIRDILNKKNPQAAVSGEFTRRNLATMGCLLLIGGATVVLERNFGSTALPGAALSGIAELTPAEQEAPAVAAQQAQETEMIRVAEHDRVSNEIVGDWLNGSAKLTISRQDDALSATYTEGNGNSHDLDVQLLPNNQVKFRSSQVGKLVNPAAYWTGDFSQETWVEVGSDGSSLTARFNETGDRSVRLIRRPVNETGGDSTLKAGDQLADAENKPSSEEVTTRYAADWLGSWVANNNQTKLTLSCASSVSCEFNDSSSMVVSGLLYEGPVREELSVWIAGDSITLKGTRSKDSRMTVEDNCYDTFVGRLSKDRRTITGRRENPCYETYLPGWTFTRPLTPG